ncbi:hypothetical protein EFP84_02220 [Leptospira kmetyi]|uniref:Uncharacterized protein n=1 Tax=Leptospira kmetyi TaxID=408139 RepID=A0AAD0UL70_9LEPT|nr:hypothetical protein EFP84_02220 [Leptospira kmetyi]
MLELFKLVERIRLDSLRRNTLSSVSGHATISVFNELVLPTSNLPLSGRPPRRKIQINYVAHPVKPFLKKLPELSKFFILFKSGF